MSTFNFVNFSCLSDFLFSACNFCFIEFGRLSTFISVSMRTLDNKTLKKDVTNKQEKAVQLLATSAFLASWMTLKWTMGLRQVGICVFFL